MIYVFLAALKLTYKCLYFYFFPFGVLIITYFYSQRCNAPIGNSLNLAATFNDGGTPEYSPLCVHTSKFFLEDLF